MWASPRHTTLLHLGSTEHYVCFLRHGLPYHTTDVWPKFIDKLDLLYSTANGLNAIIDKKLPGCPPFKTRDLVIADETLTLYYQDIIQCIWTIYGDP